MKYIILLIVLMVVSFAVTRQMDATPETVGADAQNQTASAPGVPSRPQDLQQFSTDMDKFVQDSAEQRRQKIDQQSR